MSNLSSYVQFERAHLKLLAQALAVSIENEALAIQLVVDGCNVSEDQAQAMIYAKPGSLGASSLWEVRRQAEKAEAKASGRGAGRAEKR